MVKKYFFDDLHGWRFKILTIRPDPVFYSGEYSSYMYCKVHNAPSVDLPADMSVATLVDLPADQAWLKSFLGKLKQFMEMIPCVRAYQIQNCATILTWTKGDRWLVASQSLHSLSGFSITQVPHSTDWITPLPVGNFFGVCLFRAIIKNLTNYVEKMWR